MTYHQYTAADLESPLDAALYYAGLDWPVFPLHTPDGQGGCSCGNPQCDDQGKHPRTRNGFKDATTDEATIRSWWTKWPNANVGIATGAAGLLALDVDPGKGGAATLDDLIAQHGPLPDTAESLTGGGGRHILFKAPNRAVRSSAGKLGPGLDVKAAGGYIVAPPSLHRSGRRYEWEVSSHPGEVAVADPQAWLVEAAQVEGDRSRGAPDADEEGTIPEGRRNDALFELGCRLRGMGLSTDLIAEALLAENERRCTPPLDRDEVRRIAQSTGRYEPGVFRPTPPLNPRRAARDGDGGAGMGGARLIIKTLADVEARPVDWLWRGWLARGKVHVLGGHPGDGKSTLTTVLAATLSTGGHWPDGTAAPRGRTLFLLAEDGLDDTLRPRLDWHGADVSQVFAIEAVREPDGSDRPFDLARHLPLVERAIRELGIDTLVIDPLTSFMPKSDRNAEGDVRDLLTPLGALAEKTHVAIVCIMHVGKPSGSNRRPLQQLLGATAFGAIARLVWMVAPVSPDARETRRVLAVVKSNLAMKPAAQEWSIDGEGLPIMWHGESQHDIAELLGGGGKGLRLDEAAEFIREQLKDGPLRSDELARRADAAGISISTRRRAYATLGVEAWKEQGVRDGPWYSGLPGQKEKMFNS